MNCFKAAGIARGGGRNVFVHAADVGAAFVMLVEHHAGWPAFARKTLGLQGGKQVDLFFAVVAAVGEVAEEGDGIAGRRLVEPARRLGLAHDGLQTAQDLFDDAVLARENFSVGVIVSALSELMDYIRRPMP